MDQSEFQDKVFKILKSSIDEYSYEKSDDAQIIRIVNSNQETHEVGLANLYRQHMLDPYTEDELTIELRRRVTPSGQLPETSDDGALPWDEIEARILPQLNQIGQLNKIDFIYQPFDDDIITTLVIDYEDRYQYITSKHVNDWGITENELMEHAHYNLHKYTESVEIEAYEGSDKLILVGGADGFDAARILLPAIKEMASELLGTPFFAAIPNRDFLAMWSVNNTDEFHDHTHNEVISNFKTQPHPLTPNIYELN